MIEKKIRHALVIGGSGMLRDVSLWLANQGFTPSVIGRNEHKLQSLVAQNPNILPLQVNYDDVAAFRAAIAGRIASHGAFELVVAWIHTNHQELLDVLHQENGRASDENWQLYHVLGSSDRREDIVNTASPTNNCVSYQVQLGFKIENGHSRWLTESEISQGVIQSIERKTNVLVGQLDPWEMRP